VLDRTLGCEEGNSSCASAASPMKEEGNLPGHLVVEEPQPTCPQRELVIAEASTRRYPQTNLPRGRTRAAAAAQREMGAPHVSRGDLLIMARSDHHLAGP